MRPIQVKQLAYDLTPIAGLALVGHHLKTLAPVLGEVDAALPVRTGVASSDIVRSYLGQLVQGKSDFDAIENLRGDEFFKQALGIGLLPSSPTLRQRMDAGAVALDALVPAMIERLLVRSAPDYGVLPCGCHWTSTPSPWTTAARPRRAWAPHLRRRGRLLPAGGLPGIARLLPGAVAAPGRAAFGQAHRRGSARHRAAGTAP